MAIFNSYVKLPEGKPTAIGIPAMTNVAIENHHAFFKWGGLNHAISIRAIYPSSQSLTVYQAG